tara:strand:- start:299 stop:853 length:555 start_codon:yes stop_codon:yes gene_type:complete
MSWILTATGQQFDLVNPTPEMVRPEDIAHSLSRLCRFNGHTPMHYSVAEHSMRVAQQVPEAYQLEALLHDATEAYVGDMVRPLKQMLPGYQEIERRIWLAICERFDLEPILPTCIHHADMVLLATERRDLMPQHSEQWECLQGIEPLPARIKPCSQPHAKFMFFENLKALLATTHRTKVQAGAA